MEKLVTEFKLINGKTIDIESIGSFNFDILKESIRYLNNQSFHQGIILDEICQHLSIKKYSKK